MDKMKVYYFNIKDAFPRIASDKCKGFVEAELSGKYIEERDKEIERLKNTQKRMQVIMDAYGKSTTVLDNRNERLTKEKEWQLNQIIRYKVELYFDSYGPGNEGRKIALEETEEEMQEALKE